MVAAIIKPAPRSKTVIHSTVQMLCLAGCFFLIVACVPGEMTDAEKPFFDLSGFIAEVTADSQLVSVQKTVDIAGQSEMKMMEEYALWKDEQRFDNFDINRPALFDKYRVDTVQRGGLKIISYLALDPDLQVQSFQVDFVQDVVDQIIVISQSKSFLENMKSQLTWRPGRGYLYQKSSDKLFSDHENQFIQVEVVGDGEK